MYSTFEEMGKIDAEVKTKFSNERHRFITNVVYTSGWVTNLSTEALKPFGISNQQFNILRILRGASDWVAMTDVKGLMIEKSPNATRLADKMLHKNLIERKRSTTDRRVVYIRITKVGLDLLVAIDNTDNKIMAALKNNITEKEAKQVSSILDKLRG